MSEQEQDDSSKTEEPSQKKLEDALNKGQVSNSREFTSFFMFLFITLTIIWIFPFLLSKLTMILKGILIKSTSMHFKNSLIGDVLADSFGSMLIYLMPVFLVIIIAIFLSSFIQYGRFIFAPEVLKMDIGKLSIVKGFKRLFSMRNFLEFVKGIFKITFVGFFLYLLIKSDIKELSEYSNLTISGILKEIATIINHILILMTIIMLVIGMLDFSYQKYSHYQKMKMTKQEVKEEYKQTEGHPEIKQKQRQKAQEYSKKRPKDTVPKATVVITNPTHYAIALRYNPEEDQVPICVAKGIDNLALHIREVAKEHNVAIVENKPLARDLYREINPDDPIPQKYYQAIAEIISYVLGL